MDRHPQREHEVSQVSNLCTHRGLISSSATGVINKASLRLRDLAPSRNLEPAFFITYRSFTLPRGSDVEPVSWDLFFAPLPPKFMCNDTPRRRGLIFDTVSDAGCGEVIVYDFTPKSAFGGELSIHVMSLMGC